MENFLYSIKTRQISYPKLWQTTLDKIRTELPLKHQLQLAVYPFV